MKWFLLSICSLLPALALANEGAFNVQAAQTQGLEFEQRLGAQLPLDADFVDHDGKPVTLGSYFNQGKPVVFALAYYTCPNICTVVFRETFQALQQINSIKPGDYT